MKSLDNSFAKGNLICRVAIVVIFLQLMSPLKIYSQARDLDSLKLALKNAKTDSVKVSILNSLSWRLMDVDYPKALEYALQSSKIAESIKWQSGLAYAYRNIGVAKLHQNDPNGAIEYFQRSLRIADILNDRLLEARCYGNIGNTLKDLSKYPEALEQYRRASAIIDTLTGSYQMKISLAISEGNIYQALVDYPHAIAAYHYAIEQSAQYGIMGTQIIGLNNLSSAYMRQNDFESAIKYAGQALPLAQKYGMTQGVISALGNLAESHRHLKHERIALQYFRQSLEIALRNNDHSDAAKSLASIGSVYDDQQNYNMAIRYFNKARAYAIGASDEQPTTAKILTRMGESYFKGRKFKYSLKFIDSSLAIAKKHNLLDNEIDNFRLLNIVFDTLGKTDSAYLALKAYDALNQKQIDKDSTIAIIRAEKNYDLKIQELQNKLSVAEMKEKMEKKNALGRFYIYIILVMGTWICVLYILRRDKATNKRGLWKVLSNNTGKNIFFIVLHCFVFLGIQLINGFKSEEFLPQLGELINTVFTLSFAIYSNSTPEQAEAS